MFGLKNWLYAAGMASCVRFPPQAVTRLRQRESGVRENVHPSRSGVSPFDSLPFPRVTLFHDVVLCTQRSSPVGLVLSLTRMAVAT